MENREYTGVGLYTKLAVDPDSPRLAHSGRSIEEIPKVHLTEILSRVVDRLQPRSSRVCMARYTNLAMTATLPTSSQIAPQS